MLVSNWLGVALHSAELPSFPTPCSRWLRCTSFRDQANALEKDESIPCRHIAPSHWPHEICRSLPRPLFHLPVSLSLFPFTPLSRPLPVFHSLSRVPRVLLLSLASPSPSLSCRSPAASTLPLHVFSFSLSHASFLLASSFGTVLQTSTFLSHCTHADRDFLRIHLVPLDNLLAPLFSLLLFSFFFFFFFCGTKTSFEFLPTNQLVSRDILLTRSLYSGHFVIWPTSLAEFLVPARKVFERRWCSACVG